MQNGVILAAQPYGLGLNETLMPQYLKELGYATHGVGKVQQLYVIKCRIFFSNSQMKIEKEKRKCHSNSAEVVMGTSSKGYNQLVKHNKGPQKAERCTSADFISMVILNDFIHSL